MKNKAQYLVASTPITSGASVKEETLHMMGVLSHSCIVLQCWQWIVSIFGEVSKKSKIFQVSFSQTFAIVLARGYILLLLYESTSIDSLKLEEDQISLQQPNLIPKLIQTMSWRARLGQNMHELCVVLCNTGKNSDGAR